jgi:hypothetical protein
MGKVIGEILPLAIGVAISVVPIIAVILMLFTKRAKTNSVAFLAGWVIGLVIAGGVALAIAGGSGAGGDSDEPTDGVGILKLLLGVGLIYLAARSWQKRPQEGQEAEMPRWMASIDQFGAGKSFGLAAALSGINPKNLALTVAAATTIAASGISSGEQIGVLAIFILLASVTVAAPVLTYLVMGHRADEPLNAMKTWLVAHNDAVMAVLFLVFGVKLLGDGLVIFTS